MEKRKKKMETSKLILIVSYAIGLFLIACVLYGTFAGYEMSNVTQICLASLGEVSVSSAFYYNKSKRENIIKIASSLGLTEQIDINQMLNS